MAAGFKHLLSLGQVHLTMLSELAASSSSPEQAATASTRLVVALSAHLMAANNLVSGLIGFEQRPASMVAAFVRDTAAPEVVVPYLERLSTSVAFCLDAARPGEFGAAGISDVGQ